MPATDLLNALLPSTAVTGAAAKYWLEEEGDGPEVAGVVEGLTFVSGDPSCRQVLAGHPVRPASDAGRVLESAHVYVYEQVQSFTTVADAEAVLAQNVSQLKSCRRFVATLRGETHRYTWIHTGMIVRTGGRPVAVLHQLASTTDDYLMSINEVRVGGEVMFVDINPKDRTGEKLVASINVAATNTFRQAVTTYRATHPRASWA